MQCKAILSGTFLASRCIQNFSCNICEKSLPNQITFQTQITAKRETLPKVAVETGRSRAVAMEIECKLPCFYGYRDAGADGFVWLLSGRLPPGSYISTGPLQDAA